MIPLRANASADGARELRWIPWHMAPAYAAEGWHVDWPTDGNGLPAMPHAAYSVLAWREV